MTESNLARSLFSEPKISTLRKKNLQPKSAELAIKSNQELSSTIEIPAIVADEPASDESASAEPLKTEIDDLRREVANLKQQVAQQELEQQERSAYTELLELEIEHLKANKTEAIAAQEQVSYLAAQLSQAENTAKALQHALNQQLQNNWEHQQQELVARFLEQQAYAEARLAEQSSEIENLHQLNVTLELQQQELQVAAEQSRLDLETNNQILHTLQGKLMEAKASKDELEQQLGHCQSQQLIYKQIAQETEARYTEAQKRLAEIEPQIAELQEQILKQAGQSAEYEAAIQHWKHQAINHQRHAIQLSGALERLLEAQEARKKADLEAIQSDAEASPPPVRSDRQPSNHDTQPLPAHQTIKSGGTVNLPSFLLRQR